MPFVEPLAPFTCLPRPFGSCEPVPVDKGRGTLRPPCVPFARDPAPRPLATTRGANYNRLSRERIDHIVALTISSFYRWLLSYRSTTTALASRFGPGC